jgi:hypothetical protein
MLSLSLLNAHTQANCIGVLMRQMLGLMRRWRNTTGSSSADANASTSSSADSSSTSSKVWLQEAEGSPGLCGASQLQFTAAVDACGAEVLATLTACLQGTDYLQVKAAHNALAFILDEFPWRYVPLLHRLFCTHEWCSAHSNTAPQSCLSSVSALTVTQQSSWCTFAAHGSLHSLREHAG